MGGERIACYHDFWLRYLRDHAKPQTRALHYVGTALALLSLVAGLISWDPWWIVGVVVGGYGPAWLGHFFVEGNRPATFRHPTWSLVSDFRMFGAWLSGRLSIELAKAGIADQKP
jgi:hypothetical protein